MNLLQIDAQTWTITLVGWLIVFTALVSLIIVFTNIPRLLKIKFKKVKSEKSDQTEKDKNGEKYISGDETAAIAMALHLFFEDQHDEESNIITIKRIQRRYSPWSSKIYGVRNFPNN